MSIDFDEIYPKIFVYKSRLDDVCKVHTLTEDLSAIWELGKIGVPFWKDWYTFGKTVDIHCNFSDGSETFNAKKTELIDILDSVFDEFTSHYIDFFNIKDDKLKKEMPTVCKYFPDLGAGEDHAMRYHTDFQEEKKNARGKKALITCNMYPNDNYSGGEIKYKIKQDDGFFEISYKPNAGEVVIFPSGEPYYHGVAKCHGASKYFVRSFLTTYFAGTKEWLENEKKYGKEEWEKIEKERESVEREIHFNMVN